MSKSKIYDQPCPCGSGKIFSECCACKQDDPEFSNPLNFIQTFKTIRYESKIKQCLYPDHSKCSERIIDAHSIQNNKILKRISSDGYIYMPCPKSDNPFALMTEWGRKEATVFTGFCGHHDNEIFEPIENNPFNKSVFHTFLYSYRCFAVEYHKKQEVANMQQSIFKRKPSLITLPEDKNPFKGMISAINDFQHVKDEFDRSLLTGDYDILTSIIWEFPFEVKFAATGFEAPTRDLRGKRIQNLKDFSVLAEHIFVMVFPEETKTYCIFSWLKSNDSLFSGIAEQLNSLNYEKRKNYINNLLPIISENIVLNPDAWNRFGKPQKRSFLSLVGFGANIYELFGITYNRLSSPSFDLFSM